MRYLSVAIVLLSLLTPASGSEDSIPIETLGKIKDATAYVKVEAQGLSGSGSGFIIKVDGDSALVITNHHVIAPEIETVKGNTSFSPAFGPPMGPPIGPRFGPRFGPRIGPSAPPPHFGGPGMPGLTPKKIVQSVKDAKATVVLRSSTSQEESYPAEVLAADPEFDLAVLKISGVKKMPSPIDFENKLKLVETMPVYTFGFPFGKVLATGKGGPAITVGKGSISSLRMDDDGQLEFVQIDGALNPGNSGGPVVDNRGRLVGVAVATIKNSSGIGLAIPASHLTKTLQGRLGTVLLTPTQGDGGQIVIQVEIALIDPLQKIRSVQLNYIDKRLVGEKSKPSDQISEWHGFRKLKLRIDNQLATGEITLNKNVTGVEMICQGVCMSGDGEKSFTKHLAQKIALPLPSKQIAEKVNPQIPANKPPVVDDSTDAETRIAGRKHGTRFTDEAPEGGVLIGFEVGLGKWGAGEAVYTIRPIFRTASGKETFGQQHGTDNQRQVVIKARKGYAVGGITVKGMSMVDGFSATFMKIGKNGLDKNASYKSDWVGGKGGGTETVLGGDGTLVIGIIGTERPTPSRCVGLGLLRK